MTTRTIDIKNYLQGLFVSEDAVLQKIQKACRKAQLPDIEVPSNVGKLLYCLAKIQRPKRILEVGTLGGYSTVWLAKALGEEGKIITMELDARHAAVARKNFAMSGLGDKIELREGDAKLIMQEMIEQKEEPFDLIFIDADKENYPLYLEKVVQLSKSGALILSDNLIPRGDDIGTSEPDTLAARGIYQFNQDLSSHPKLETILATTIVGEKGRIDALGISIVK